MSRGKPEDATFIGNIVWDPSHWFDLAITSLKERKIGTLKDFFTNFIEKTNSFAGILNRGNGYVLFICLFNPITSKILKNNNNTPYCTIM